MYYHTCFNPYHATGAYMHSQMDCSITPKWHPRLTVMLTVECFLLLKVADTINGELYCEHTYCAAPEAFRT